MVAMPIVEPPKQIRIEKNPCSVAEIYAVLGQIAVALLLIPL